MMCIMFIMLLFIMLIMIILYFILFQPLSSPFIPFILFHPLSSSFILFRSLSSSFILFHPLSSSFNLFHSLSSSFILFCSLSSSSILFHPLSSSFNLFHPLSSVSLLIYFSCRHVCFCLFSKIMTALTGWLQGQSFDLQARAMAKKMVGYFNSDVGKIWDFKSIVLSPSDWLASSSRTHRSQPIDERFQDMKHTLSRTNTPNWDVLPVYIKIPHTGDTNSLDRCG